MNILILGDIVGPPGRKALKNNLKKIIEEKKIDFTIVNGENAADDGRGITKNIVDDFFELGVDVITSGNHIWDKSETTEFITKEKRLLRPANLAEGTPGSGYGVYLTKNQNFKVAVINLMANKLKKEADFIVVDLHGETTSEKIAMGYFFDGKATMLVGTHTHIPTADSRILDNGTAYQTDIGMCGDYNSVIGMNKQNSVMKFLKDDKAKKHFPATGEASLSGLIVDADEKTGLAKSIERFIQGGVLTN